MVRRYKIKTGIEYVLDNKSIFVRLISMTKENVFLDEIDLKVIISGLSEFMAKISRKYKSTHELFGDLQVENDNIDINELTFYKFVSTQTLNNFLKKGKFQLGSIKLYREIENEHIRDENEGLCNLLITSKKRQMFISLLSGFNHYIFCGTDSIDDKSLMSDKFGKVCIKVKNIKSFADKIQKNIGAKSWKIEKVKYTDYKLYSINHNFKNIDDINPDLNEELFNYLFDISLFPSVFYKPMRFSNENELRLTFEMQKNVKKKLHFDNLGLWKEIEIIR